MKTVKKLSKHRFRLLRQYKEEYIHAIDKQLKKYEEHNSSKSCPLCLVARNIKDTEYPLLPTAIYKSRLFTCYYCLWYILEGNVCRSWLDANSNNKVGSFESIIVGDSKLTKKIRNKRIKMLKEWQKLLHNI